MPGLSAIVDVKVGKGREEVAINEAETFLEPDPRTPLGTCVRGRDVLSGNILEINHADGAIVAVRRLERGPERDASLPWVAPGLVDLQINGYHGHDFNESSLNPDTVGSLAPLLALHGLTTYFPTLVSNSDQALSAALRILARNGHEADGFGMIGGIHLEGPFISRQTGARGAHAAAFIGPPDWARLQAWQESAQGMIKIITLSPEWPDSTRFIERCVGAGILVSIGHTAATPEQIRDAVAAGARMSTHLGNGTHAHLPRHPNYLWEQLANDGLAATVIADGFHLPDSVISVILRVKGQQALLVSDAVSVGGMPVGTYDRHIGGRVVLTEGGRLHLDNQPELLAGSVAMLPTCIAHLVNHQLATLDSAWRMASTSPAAIVDLAAAAGLGVGAPADLVLFEWDGDEVNVLTTIKGGNVVYERRSAP